MHDLKIRICHHEGKSSDIGAIAPLVITLRTQDRMFWYLYRLLNMIKSSNLLGAMDVRKFSKLLDYIYIFQCLYMTLIRNKISIIIYLLLNLWLYIHFMMSIQNYKYFISLFHTKIFGCYKANNILDREKIISGELVQVFKTKITLRNLEMHALNYSLNTTSKTSEKKLKANYCIMC